MAIPNLQVALDQSSLSDALGTVQKVGEEVDIIEAGTILCLAEGMQAVKCLRALYPDKIIVADTKCADAGSTVAENCRAAGADWMTAICSATLPTMKKAAEEISELQVELYGNWTYQDAEDWLEAGISQAVYHQSRDALLAGETWGEKDLTRVKRLAEMGFRVSVTGGLEIDTLPLFQDVEVFTFIAGRSITEATDPQMAARKMKQTIREIFGASS
ncbi:3-keto-L-gulonate-6-phosphate decarboxylase [Listeria floridensis FSL S10-1187]|uniref:3-keto-L-gulonate-6-phosphate decarboxylase n=1 Tax=Listeria floridensis FSL S10-1187 TaxID=1265817 RepID=A0ABP3AXP5_9LIST|nr:3-keto-L-gulonate-6-phosphate decarboxylase UlaD [Listeria floridensis]EUJ31670.1 3-keto-L-gulonate-6-phosphate decarboxylase [Listeria floridensis FSL S10-1187]